MAIFILVLGILIFIGLIVIHEFGHFIVATRNGVEAEEFAIFFGPTLYKRKTKKGWTFKFNLLPLGGYVKLKGEHDSDTQKGSYGAASLYVKSKIMLAGVFANLIIGIFILLILAIVGMPKIIPNQFSIPSNEKVVSSKTALVEVGSILKDSPAAKAGLKPGDMLISIGVSNNVKKITNIYDLQSVTKEFAGQKVTIKYKRNSTEYSTSTVLNTTKEVESSYSKTHQKVYLGVSVGQYYSGFTTVRYTWAAPIVALGTTKQVFYLTFKGLGTAIKGLGGIIAGASTNNQLARKNAQTTASSQLVGPVGIFVILKDGSAAGIYFMLFILAIISLTLAIMNVLPIPALDGGRFWLTLFTRGIKKPLSPKREELVNAIGMLLLLALLAVVTYLDIKRFF